MLKEKFESVKKFVKEHKVEIALGGLTAALGAALIYQDKINGAMIKLHKKEADALQTLTIGLVAMNAGVEMANDDIQALAQHCGLTAEDLIKISLEAKEALTETCKDLIED